MSTQTKFKIGDFVRVLTFAPQHENDEYGTQFWPEGETGKVSKIYGIDDAPYVLVFDGDADGWVKLFAEDELELVSAPSPKLPGIVTTEWGVRSPWGDGSSANYETARVTVKNMRDAGHVDASVIWRGVTEWQVKE